MVEDDILFEGRISIGNKRELYVVIASEGIKVFENLDVNHPVKSFNWNDSVKFYIPESHEIRFKIDFEINDSLEFSTLSYFDFVCCKNAFLELKNRFEECNSSSSKDKNGSSGSLLLDIEDDSEISGNQIRFEKNGIRCKGISFPLDLSRYRIGKILGTGSFGIVVSAEDRLKKISVAIKMVPNIYTMSPAITKELFRELLFLELFNHPNIVSFYDVDIFEDKIYIITEKCDYPLQKFVHIEKYDHFSPSQKLSFIHQMMQGLFYIHSLHIIHRDIKPLNVLITEKLQIKFCDFGTSRCIRPPSQLEADALDPRKTPPPSLSPALPDNIDHSQPLTEYVVTRWYRAPEVILTCGKYGYEQDVWSLGCTIVYMILKKPLLPGENTIHQLQLILELCSPLKNTDLDFDMSETSLKYLTRKTSQMNHPTTSSSSTATTTTTTMKRGGLEDLLSPGNNIHPQLSNLLQQMLQFNPKHRISAVDILLHPIFQHDTDESVVAFSSLCSTPQRSKLQAISDASFIRLHNMSFDMEDDNDDGDGDGYVVNQRMRTFIEKELWLLKQRLAENSFIDRLEYSTNSPRDQAITHLSSSNPGSFFQGHSQTAQSKPLSQQQSQLYKPQGSRNLSPLERPSLSLLTPRSLSSESLQTHHTFTAEGGTGGFPDGIASHRGSSRRQSLTTLQFRPDGMVLREDSERANRNGSQSSGPTTRSAPLMLSQEGSTSPPMRLPVLPSPLNPVRLTRKMSSSGGLVTPREREEKSDDPELYLDIGDDVLGESSDHQRLFSPVVPVRPHSLDMRRASLPDLLLNSARPASTSTISPMLLDQGGPSLLSQSPSLGIPSTEATALNPVRLSRRLSSKEMNELLQLDTSEAVLVTSISDVIGESRGPPSLASSGKKSSRRLTEGGSWDISPDAKAKENSNQLESLGGKIGDISTNPKLQRNDSFTEYLSEDGEFRRGLEKQMSKSDWTRSTLAPLNSLSPEKLRSRSVAVSKDEAMTISSNLMRKRNSIGSIASPFALPLPSDSSTVSSSTSSPNEQSNNNRPSDWSSSLANGANDSEHIAPTTNSLLYDGSLGSHFSSLERPRATSNIIIPTAGARRERRHQQRLMASQSLSLNYDSEVSPRSAETGYTYDEKMT